FAQVIFNVFFRHPTTFASTLNIGHLQTVLCQHTTYRWTSYFTITFVSRCCSWSLTCSGNCTCSNNTYHFISGNCRTFSVKNFRQYAVCCSNNFKYHFVSFNINQVLVACYCITWFNVPSSNSSV